MTPSPVAAASRAVRETNSGGLSLHDLLDYAILTVNNASYDNAAK